MPAVAELVQGRKQREVYEAYFSGDYDIVCISSGRQAGKSYSAAYIARDWLLKGGNGGVYWVVCPSMRLTKVVFKRLKSVLSGSGVPTSDLQIHDSNQEISITYRPTGSLIDFRTAKQQGYLVGETLSGLHIDEAGQIEDPRVFFEDLLPACAVMEAPILITGTPKSAAKWYRDLFNSGVPDNPRFNKSGFRVKSFTMDARDNPAGGGIVKRFHQYQQMAENGQYPMETFNQEWLGQWIDSGGSVFRHLEEAVALGKDIARRNYEDVEHKHIVHVDLGRTADYTACAVFADRHIYDPDSGLRILVCKAIEKIPHMDYVRCGRRIHKICEDWGDKYPARVSMDGTGLPAATKITLGSSGLRIYWHEWRTSQHYDNRTDAIGQLQSYLDTYRIALPDSDELLEEMAAFTEKELPSGKTRLEAGDGYHDDMTFAVIQGVYLLASRFMAIRYRSDQHAAKATAFKDPRRGPEEDDGKKKYAFKKGLPRMQRNRRHGRTGGFFN